MIDNSRNCFHGNVIFGSQGQMRLSSNKLWNGTRVLRERGAWPVGTRILLWNTKLSKPQHIYCAFNIMALNLLAGEDRGSVHFSSVNIITIKLDVEFGAWCVDFLLAILTFLISGDSGSVTSCPVVWPSCTRRCLRVIPEAYGKKLMPIY